MSGTIANRVCPIFSSFSLPLLFPRHFTPFNLNIDY
jgi:hypothetical protein